MSPRSRERILASLESVYREAYDGASQAGDRDRMSQLDASFQREQLILEVLIDIRDALLAITEAPNSTSALEKLEMLRKLTKLR